MSITHANLATAKDAPKGTLAEVGNDLAARPYARRGVSLTEAPIRVLLVDDHNLVRAGVRLVLRAFSDITVVGEATSGDEAITMAKRLQPNIIVMDLDMPN